MLNGGAENGAALRGKQPQAEVDGNTGLQRVSLECIMNRAIADLRQWRYLKQDTLGYPVLVLRTPAYRSEEQPTTAQK